MQRRVKSFEEFLENVRYFVDVVAEYSGDFVVFPEMFSLQILSIEDQELNSAEAIEALTKYTPRFIEDPCGRRSRGKRRIYFPA